MKNIILMLITFIYQNFLFSQLNTDSIRKGKIILLTPVKYNTKINGLAIGLSATNRNNTKILHINGLNIEIAPLSVIGGMYALGGTVSSLLLHKKDSINRPEWDLISKNDYTEIDTLNGTKIKGVSISIGGVLRENKIDGISINGLVCFVNQMNGFELSGLMNLHYSFKGFMIAGLRNKCTKGNGIQIGLINSCKNGNVLQIGLINKIGNRTIPFINFNRKKK